jgi:hypothetical protein
LLPSAESVSSRMSRDTVSPNTLSPSRMLGTDTAVPCSTFLTHRARTWCPNLIPPPTPTGQKIRICRNPLTWIYTFTPRLESHRSPARKRSRSNRGVHGIWKLRCGLLGYVACNFVWGSWRFGGSYCFHLQGWRSHQFSNYDFVS